MLSTGKFVAGVPEPTRALFWNASLLERSAE